MHKLIIHKLGPINHCELDCSQVMTFTGFQASGKSTIAKAIYYFRTIKDEIFSLAEGRALIEYTLENDKKETSLSSDLLDHLREKFLRVFGSSYGMDNDMFIEYHYSEHCNIRVNLREEKVYSTPNYIWIDFNKDLYEFLKENNKIFTATALGVPELQKQHFQKELNKFFDDEYSVVYIPAGRSLLTLLSQQLSSIYSNMKDFQKRTIDYCMQDYIERILMIKPEFSEGLEGVMAYYGEKHKVNKTILDYAYEKIQKVLKGRYVFNNGEEKILISGKRYVKINFASSGQQEAVWILNLLFYYLSKNEPVLFIIEEPESNLFPEAQKYITELIALVNNSKNSVVITTHSPYVLGTLNNLLYAAQTPEDIKENACEIIPEDYWLDYNHFNAWFVRDGGIDNCMDDEIMLIQNERIDDISKVINNDFDRLFELQLDFEEGENDAP